MLLFNCFGTHWGIDNASIEQFFCFVILTNYHKICFLKLFKIVFNIDEHLFTAYDHNWNVFFKDSSKQPPESVKILIRILSWYQVWETKIKSITLFEHYGSNLPYETLHLSEQTLSR